MSDWIQDVLLKWRSEGVKLNPPASIAQIENVESVLDFKFPQDFKDFYLRINGFTNFDWQEHMFTFWPLSLIIEEFESSSDKNFIGFCDFLIASHCIGFDRNKKGVCKSYGYGYEDRFIAQTFEEVVDMINSSNDLIY